MFSLSKFLRFISLLLFFQLCTHCNGKSENQNENHPQNSDLNQNHPLPEKTGVVLTEEYKTISTGKVEDLHSVLREFTEDGLMDSHNFKITVFKHEIENNFNVNELNCIASTCSLSVNSENYKKASESIKIKMVDEIIHSYYSMSAFKVKVQNPENIYAPIEEVSPSEFLNKWAYKKSESIGPNCFHSALATANIGSLEPHFVSEEELNEHLGHSFHEVPRLEKFGDVVVLFSETGMEHAASFVGRDQEGKEIVFTKNGRVTGYYMFMDLNELMTHHHGYRDTSAKFYSLNSNQI